MSERSGEARDNGGVLVNGQPLTDVESYYITTGGNGSNAIGSLYAYSMTNIRLGEASLSYNLPVEKLGWIKDEDLKLVG